jgi:hypothetical protein
LPDALEAPIVTFRDGIKCTIAFSVVDHILDEDAAKIVAYSGGTTNAREAVEAPTFAAIFSVMERYSYREVRLRRAAIEGELRVLLTPKYKAYGLTLDSISLKDITPVSKP